MTSTGAKQLSGHCLCGAVRFEATSDGGGVTACHCSQCRRWSGHYWASRNVPLAGFRFLAGESRVKWVRASDYARRGFCAECGASLFWHGYGLESHRERIAIAAGSLDQPTGAAIDRHIFTADKGDYYDIADGAPQIETY
jgi:hypothetical protein